MISHPSIRYFGGQSLPGEQLIPLLPLHQTYVEVFGGTGALLITKEPSPIEVYNDVDADLVNFMDVLSDRNGLFLDFYQHAKQSAYTREEWQFCRDHLNDDPSPVERARRFFVVARFALSGLAGNAFTEKIVGPQDGMIREASAYQDILSRLPLLSERMKSVIVENRDFADLIWRYDTTETFFFLDPPVLPQNRRQNAYPCEMTTKDHEALLDILRDIKGKAMLVGYDNALYDTLGWHKHTLITPVTGTGSKSSKHSLCVWLNYAIPSSTPNEQTSV